MNTVVLSRGNVARSTVSFFLVIAICVTLVQGQSFGVGTIAYSPDGSLIATGGAEGLAIWDSDSGALVRTMNGPISALAWSPDGTRLATVDSISNVRIWDTSTWSISLEFTDFPFTTYFFDIDWNPEGTEIVVSGDLANLSIFNAITGAVVARLIAHADPVSAVDWSPDGEHILSGDWDGQIILWEATTGSILNRFSAEDAHSIGAIDWHPNSLIAAVGFTDGSIRLWDPFNATEVRQVQGHVQQDVFGVTAVAWAVDGTYLVSSGGDGMIRVWDSNLMLVQEFPVRGISWDIGVRTSSFEIAYFPSTIALTTIPIATVPSPTPSPTPTATPTPAPTQTGGGGQIAYDGGCTRPDGMTMLGTICGLNVSGGDTFYLTTGDDPALASGNRAAYVTNSGGRFASGGVYVFDSDDQGSTSTVVTSSGTYAEPAWSPDESKLVYAYRPSGSNSKYVVRTVNLDGSGVQTLTADSVNSRAPHWSAASGKIVYYSDQDGDNEIWVMNADGSGKVQLTTNSADDLRLLENDHVTPSMSDVGRCYDNAMQESFWGTLKTECADRPFPIRAAARKAIFEYIEVWYNRQRRHSALGYLSPAEFEQLACP